MLKDLPVLDCHVHYAHPDLLGGMLQVMDDNRVDKFNLVCTPHRTRVSMVPEALHLKAHFPDRITVFGGLDISAYFAPPEVCARLLSSSVDTLVSMGCDGVKMIEGKPDIRKILPIPAFDSPVYAPYWEKMAGIGYPLLFHVNDPEEFWDAALVPDWAKEQGWFYGDGSYIHNEENYTQVLNVLAQNPGLKVIFAHFFFFSNQLERLAKTLERFPNMHVDLTPGIEMYHNFARHPQKVHDFFTKYQDRILFGTDIGARALAQAPGSGMDAADSAVRVELVRKFLELDGSFRLELSEGYLFGKFGGDFQGIGLPEEVLKKIYYQNFEKLAGKQPRPLNPDAIIADCSRLIQVIPAMSAAIPGGRGDVSVAEQVRSYFASSN